MELVFIHGPPAAGKLTVAKALVDLTGYPLFHNHLVVDALSAVFPFGSEAFVRLRQAFWLEVFETAAAEGRSLIFTFAPESTVPADFVAQAQARVAKAGGSVRFVALEISDEEQERRLVAEDRARFNKLRSLDILRRLRAGPSGVDPPAELTIDTVATPPDVAARRIVEALALQPLAAAYAPFGD
jgi:chloramphenicol 3-O-phosphotransferase